ncbi:MULTISPECIES: hypothetical protein [unclassified Variovorax]|uniref:hypothetical protein n=1 Tax=unclassified Variovorax TaxID=663243 RepID=UPI00076D3BC0|nr:MULTISPECIES: hypothetical protein [unclassified Variovorax]KWT64526.1 hypothetical protein APY03_7704 [Variovorax sp. WDL1]PNG56398.1 hypothetical protein CHC07_02815 [Variovorax sp. B4]PNG57822.1 hypothetical protein CHC06_02818 [Variovorax sp. B2]VTV09737.1 hypothetical protein WDL1CHR_00810 [Variovorax sp. WDL1]
MSHLPIGVFDSGVGGLSDLSALPAELPPAATAIDCETCPHFNVTIVLKFCCRVDPNGSKFDHYRIGEIQHRGNNCSHTLQETHA